MSGPRYTSDEVVQRGRELYEQGIRSKVEAAHKGKYLVIDVDTGDYEIGDDYMALTDRLQTRHPEAALCTLRIGYPAVGRIGGRLAPAPP